MDFTFTPFEPAPLLRHCVRQTFYAHGRIGYQTEKILPTGVIAVLINLGHPHRLGKAPDPAANPAFADGWIQGLQTTPDYHTPTDGTHVLGILFEPPGFFEAFGADMANLVDKVHPLDILPQDFLVHLEVWRRDPGAPATHTAIGDAIIGRSRSSLPEWFRKAYDDIVRNRGAVNLESLYRGSGLSDRRAVEVFKRGVGVTPKVLCRIHRLLALLEAVDPAADVSWADLAHQFGFFDQAHFNREFRKLAGLYPSEYLSQRRAAYDDLVAGEHVTFAPQD